MFSRFRVIDGGKRTPETLEIGVLGFIGTLELLSVGNSWGFGLVYNVILVVWNFSGRMASRSGLVDVVSDLSIFSCLLRIMGHCVLQ